MDFEPAKRVNGRMWQPGQSGNPLGRPIGARGRFSQQFIEDMRVSWEKHGATVMDRVAVEYPDRYLGIAAHLIPKEVEATITAGHTGLDGSDLALLKACKAEIEGVESMSPQQVFEIVREALRAAQAKQIDCSFFGRFAYRAYVNAGMRAFPLPARDIANHHFSDS